MNAGDYLKKIQESAKTASDYVGEIKAQLELSVDLIKTYGEEQSTEHSENPINKSGTKKPNS